MPPTHAASKSRGRTGRARYVVDKPQYNVRTTATGTHREFKHADGKKYREYTSHASLFGLPAVSVVNGISPETGRSGVARGFVAIGQWASGVIAIGQFTRGCFCVGQFGQAAVMGVGQFMVAPIAIGQMALGVLAGAGQFATGLFAAGQMGVAGFGAFQIGATWWGGVGMKIYDLSELLGI